MGVHSKVRHCKSHYVERISECWRGFAKCRTLYSSWSKGVLDARDSLHYHFHKSLKRFDVHNPVLPQKEPVINYKFLQSFGQMGFVYVIN